MPKSKPPIATDSSLRTVYSTLGARMDMVEMIDGLMQGVDRDLVKSRRKMNAKRFANIILKTQTTRLTHGRKAG